MAAPWWQNLCAGPTVEIAGMSVVGPWIEYANTDLIRTGEVETIAEADLTWGDKNVRVYKKARGLDMVRRGHIRGGIAVYPAVFPADRHRPGRVQECSGSADARERGPGVRR